jgi:hypothetical protein
MDTGSIVAELRWLKKRVCDAARYLLTIHVIPNEESSARMSVRINRLLRKRLEFVLIVGRHLLSIHHLPTFVARWNVARHDPNHLIGHCLKKFFVNAYNVAENFTEGHMKLRNRVVNSVLVNARSILNVLTSILLRGFMVLDHGIKQGRGFLNETKMLVRNVVLLVSDLVFTIRISNVMAGKKVMKISLPSVCLAT